MKTMYLFIVGCLCVLGVNAQSAKQKTALFQIAAAMQEQENCWNQGDIPCFMKHYWKSDSLRFIGKSGVTYGWQQTLDNYLQSYPDKAAMGKLIFSNLALEFTDKNTVLVIGKWRLVREPSMENLEGHYSLLWKKMGSAWVIVLDHSS